MPVRTDAGLIAPAANSPDGVRVFRGIPFGAPPIGPLRWKAPQPVAPWDGVRKADAFGPVCVQPKGVGRLNVSVDMPDSPKADEDCLYLNVWTGAARASERRPVMVWIFGGAYTEGAGSSRHNDGEALARKGAVLVTFNYRLGPFGFFSHPELTKESGHNASGNQAVLDALAALAVGAEQHRGVRRRSGQRHDLRRIGGRVAVRGPRRVAAGRRACSGARFRKAAPGWASAWRRCGRARRPRTPAGRGASPMQSAPLAELRAKSTDEIIQALRGAGMIVDGWAIPEDLSADVRAPAGRTRWTCSSDRTRTKDRSSCAARPPSSGRAACAGRWGDLADAYLKLYPAGSDAEAAKSSEAAFSRRDGVAHAPVCPGAGEAREAGVPLLLHARAAGRRRPAEPARDAHGGNSVRVQQPEGRTRVPRHELARAVVGIRSRPQAGRHRVVLLGELRAHGQPERQGPRRVAGVS